MQFKKRGADSIEEAIVDKDSMAVMWCNTFTAFTTTGIWVQPVKIADHNSRAAYTVRTEYQDKAEVQTWIRHFKNGQWQDYTFWGQQSVYITTDDIKSSVWVSYLSNKIPGIRIFGSICDDTIPI